MCGRYNLRATPQDLIKAFELFRDPPSQERYNIAPTQQVLTIRADDERHRVPAIVKWGLIPSWSKDAKLAATMINARAETVAEKPAFRTAFKKRRCLVPASGFYEWKKIGARKQPYHIRLRSQPIFAFAGLWETWRPPEGGDPVETCTILTTGANEGMSGLHERMPVILPREALGLWLDQDIDEPEALLPLLQAYDPDDIVMSAVNPALNNARFEDPACLEPVEVAED